MARYGRIYCEPIRLKVAIDGLDVYYIDKRTATVESDDEQVIITEGGTEVLREYWYSFLVPRYNVDHHSVRELVCWIQECLDDIPPLPGDTNNLLSITTVDCTVLGTTELLPVINNVFVEQAYALVTEIDGGSGRALFPDVSIGRNGSTDLFMPTKLLRLDELNDYYHFNTTAKKKLAVSGDTIDLSVSLQSNASTYILTIYLYGYEF
jgi:hypothetical protein